MVDHDVVCVCMDTVVNGTWQLAVHSRTNSGLACYNYLLVVTVFPPPLSRWSCSARRGRVKRKGRDASEQLQPFHTPATKSATTTVDMMRKDDDGEDEEKDDDDDNNNNNNNVWLPWTRETNVRPSLLPPVPSHQ